MRKLYTTLASMVQARINCKANGNSEWFERHTDNAESLVKKHMPSGSGFDAGTTIDFDRSTGERIVFNTSFHHMDENGYYCGWTEHVVTVRPSLLHGFMLTVSGKDRNGIKEYIVDRFNFALDVEVG